MEHLLTLRIDLPVPTLNSLYRTNKFQKVYKSAKAKEFCEYVNTTFKQEELIEGDIKVVIDLFISRDCDIDAKLKC
jgi:Holliday junction resolvase RusA-like endonuclease